MLEALRKKENGRVETRRHGEGSPWSYRDLQMRQVAVLDEILAGGRGRILLSEVAPVVTLGLREVREDLLANLEDFLARGIAIEHTSRGGRATYHGPGQWVAFPVERLENLTGDRKGVRLAVERVLDASLEVCRIRYPEAEIRGGCAAGVWSLPGARGGKIVSVGMRFDRGILQHGLAMNVYRTPESFYGIRPCGLEAQVAFLEEGPGGNAETMEKKFVEWGKKLEIALLERFPCFLVGCS